MKTLVALLISAEQPMFVAWGPERIWIYNDAFIPVLGHKHPDALGRRSDGVWAEAWDDLGPLFDRVFAGEAINRTGFTVGLDRDGGVKDAHFDFSYTPVHGADDAIAGLFGNCYETTDSVRSASRRIAAAEHERDQIFETSRDLFAVATFDGYLRSINPAWSRQLGRSDTDLLARPFADIIHPDDLATTGDVIAALQRGEAVHQFHVRLLRADGSAISYAWSAVPEGDHFYTVGRDISDDERREAALRQSQKMEAMGQLTGGLAHDFNNLLQAAHGNLDLISRRPDDAAKVARWARAALQATERGARLTAQLLAFSRAQKLELRPTAIGALIAGMDDILHSSLGPMIRVAVELERSDLAVMADPTQFEMALLNLAINARDAMPEGGDLSITGRERVVADDPELAAGRYVEIRVSDTGPGMPAAVAARAFDPFFTTKETGKGTGLGLSQVYGTARQAGGRAAIERHVPRGTTVSLLLPAAEVPADARAVDARAGGPARTMGRIILVVDDDAEIRQFLSDSLEALGFEVVMAEDGAAGLSLLERVGPDLLLLDYAMPGMTGAELADRVRAMRPDLPIIFASGYSDTAAIEAAVGPSAVLLRKPFGVGELETVVREALAA